MKVGFHGCRNRLEVLEVVMTDDGVDIGVLGEVDRVAFTVTVDLNAKKPVELTKVSDVNMLRNFPFEV